MQENGEIDLNDKKHADQFEAFLTRTPKIYNMHLSLLEAKLFVNQREEPRFVHVYPSRQGKQNHHRGTGHFALQAVDHTGKNIKYPSWI